MEIINGLLPQLDHLGFWGYWVILLVALVESLAFVGIIIPGATVIVFMGFLSARGGLDIGDLIWFTAIGGMLGDGISFYLGKQGENFFTKFNRFISPIRLEKAEKFFKQHGSKSVFLGRFIGPVRPIIPFVAGLFHMDSRTFFFWNILSAFGFATLYLLLGYFLGNAWQKAETWSAEVGYILISMAVIAGIIYFFKKSGHRA